MFKKIMLSLLFAGFSFASSNIAILDIAKCFEVSEIAKKKIADVQEANKDFIEEVKKATKEFEDCQSKLNDKNYMDSLSASAEKKMRERTEKASEVLSDIKRKEYLQNLASSQKIQEEVLQSINEASDVVVKSKSVDLVLVKDVVFYNKDSFEITDDVIEEMNKNFKK